MHELHTLMALRILWHILIAESILKLADIYQRIISFVGIQRKIGLSVYMCPWIKLNHVGTYIFRGDMSSIAKLGASPTSTKKSNPKNYKKKKLGIRP